MSELRVTHHAGLVPYQQAWDEQRRLHEARVADEITDTVVLLEHEPVFTAGKLTKAWERPGSDAGAPVVDVDRGGKITWHGPGQLVGYPIIALPGRLDVVAYVRRVEQLMIDVCAEFGLTTERIKGRSGVWMPADTRSGVRKVGAVGIRVSRGVSMHGFSLNCDCDLSWFDQIVPCGISDAGVTSISREIGHSVSVADVLPRVREHLAVVQVASPAAVTPPSTSATAGTSATPRHVASGARDLVG